MCLLWVFEKPMYNSWRSKTTSNKELIIQTNSGALLPVPAKKLLFTRRRWQISKRGLFPAFIKLICLPTHSKHARARKPTTVTKFFPTYNGNPSEGRHALAHSGEVVEELRAAVLLAELLHFSDHFADRLQEPGQHILPRKEATRYFFPFFTLLTLLWRM